MPERSTVLLINRHFNKARMFLHACARETGQEIASIFVSVITSGWMVRMSHCGCAITPASVSHSLAARCAGSHKGCERRKKFRVGETDRALQRGRLAG